MRIAYYLPEQVQNNAELLSRFDFDKDFLDTKIGVQQRRVASDAQSTSDLCVAAAEELARKYPEFNLQDVDMAIVCTQNGDFKLPHTSAIVQSKMGLLKHAMCFDLGLGCSGFVYGLSLIQGAIASGTATNALFFTCDPYSKVIDQNDRNTVLLFGDAAAVTWITTHDLDTNLRIGAFDWGTEGEYFDSLIIRGGGTVMPACASVRDEDYSYFMDGRNVYQYVLRSIPGSVKRCLEKNKMNMEDVDYFVFHQASGHILNSLGRLLRIPEEKVVREFSDIGNTVSSTIPITLARLAEKTDLQGQTILMSGFGVGFSWGTVVVAF